MSVINLTPCDELVDGGGGERAQIFRFSGDAKNLAGSGTTASTAIPTGTKVMRIVSDTAGYYKLGGSGVEAAAADILLPANVIEFIYPKDGETHFAWIDK